MRITAPICVVLDTTPLSLLADKRGSIHGDACKNWYGGLEAIGCRFLVPEIADFEARRELLRAGKTASVARLDAFNDAEPDRYMPISTPDVRLAASLWAQARQAGRVTADPKSLDADVLIAAQALRLVPADYRLSGMVIATANAAHMRHYAASALWSDLQP